MFRHRKSQYRHYLNCSREPNLDRRIFKCDNCEKDFNRKDVLNKHKEKSHKKVKLIRNRNYSCEVCGSKLRSKLIHVPKVLHKCNSCKRSFKRLDYYEKYLCMVAQQVLEENNQELIGDQELSDMFMAFLQVRVELA